MVEATQAAKNNATSSATLTQENQTDLLKSGGIGALVGHFFAGRPVLGFLAGAAWKLFSTDGMADGMKKVVGDIAQGVDVEGIKESLGATVDGSKATDERNETDARQNAGKAGIPWKPLLVGFVGLKVLQNLFCRPQGQWGYPAYAGHGSFGGGNILQQLFNPYQTGW